MKTIYLKGSNKETLQAMQKAGFNVTTCGNCGEIKLHQTGVSELECEYCGTVSDISDFPDLYEVGA